MSVIYIVEDDKNISEIESYALKNSGYQVESFENAKNILEQMPGSQTGTDFAGCDASGQ